jgi:tripartite-type tricarboxylate transporter receptor subunit TctC
MRGLIRHVAAAALILGGLTPAMAEDFYAGKQITVLAGFGVGGGYDAYARLIFRYMPKYIPGHPSIVVQNLPAAGSLVAMNTLANSAAKDGTVIGAVQNHIGVEPLMGVTGPVENAKYDARKMNWLGSAAKEYPVVVVSDKAPVKTFKDVMERETLVGSSGVATSDSVYARIMNELVGTKFKVIDGYKDNPSMVLATEAGEIWGRAGWFLSSLLSTQGKEVEEGKLRILVQVALEKHPALKNVPLVTDFISDPEKKKQLEFSLRWLPMGRPYVAPAGVPPERVKILREAFMKTLADPELLADAKRMHLEVSPITGEDIHKLLDEVYATPKPTVEAVRKIMVMK